MSLNSTLIDLSTSIDRLTREIGRIQCNVNRCLSSHANTADVLTNAIVDNDGVDILTDDHVEYALNIWFTTRDHMFKNHLGEGWIEKLKSNAELLYGEDWQRKLLKRTARTRRPPWEHTP